jgi:response regulator RpfG family c-di-GMP phosphodiesterase
MEPDLRAVSVDDEKVNLLLIERMSAELGIAVTSFTNPLEAVAHVQANPVDLVFVDSRMPELDGVAFTQMLRSRYADIPILMITDISDDEELKSRALRAGASEFLGKPITMTEFSARVKNLALVRRGQLFHKEWAQLLQKELEKATRKILAREQDTLHSMARAAERDGPGTANHLFRVAGYARIVAAAAGERDFQQELILKSAPLHDIGNIAVPRAIFVKPGRLTEDELAAVKLHTTVGFELIRDSPSPFLQTGSTIALTHHERFDGSGYPKGLRGEEIPLFGRITAIADVFDAVLSRRSYRAPLSPEQAYAHMESGRGTQFDPRLLDLFLGSRDQVEEIREAYPEP